MRIKALSRELLCGRHALDLRPYFFFAPLAILVIPLQETSLSDPNSFLLWFFISVLSFLGQIIFIKLLQMLLIDKRDFQPFAIWRIFAIGGASGAIKALIVYQGPIYLGMPTEASLNLAGRLVTGTFVGICVVPVFAVISNQFFLFTQRRQILMQALVTGESLKFANQEALTRVREATQLAIESEFSSLLSETKKQIENNEGRSLSQQYELISQALTSSAENLIRPMSHRLMIDLTQDFPSPPLRSIFFLALKKPILPILPSLFLTNIAVVVAVIREVPSALIVTLICSLQTLITFIQIMSIKAIVKSPISHKKALAAPLFIVISTWLNVFIDQKLLLLLLEQDYNFLYTQRLVLNFLWVLAFICIVSFVANLIENEASVEAFISGLIQTHKIDKLLADQEILRVKHDIARYLHGNLQSRVMALGLSLKVRETKDQVSLDTALSLSQSLLDSPFSEYLAQEDRSLLDEVSFNAAKWDGLLDIQVDIKVEDSHLSQVQKRAVGAALEEALANALRHGLANEVEIRISENESGVTVSVLDDGLGPRQTPPGLGSRLYDSIATRGWTLQHRLDESGTILELRI